MKSCHEENEDFKINGNKVVVLAGNPNSGKSVFFHKLTGIYNTVFNYPGTTLSIIQGKYRDYAVIDTPGVYGISSFTAEEKITKEIIMKAKGVLNIVNALYLERELFLTLQLMDMGIPTIVVLNFMDEAEKQGIKIDIKKLSSMLVVKVIPSVAVEGIGIKEIKGNLSKIKPSSIPRFDYERCFDGHAKNNLEGLHKIKNRAEYILALEGDKNILSKYDPNLDISPDAVYRKRRERIDGIIKEAVIKEPQKQTFKRGIASLMVHPVFGF